jgi:NADPH:quinone reductase-like Zn-dependent oxidoreductase
MTLAITYPANDGEPADLLEVTEIADPPPPGPGQIQVDVRAFPLHPGDLYLIPPAPGRRAVAGLEATGVVASAGPGVNTPAAGSRVTVFPNPGSWAQRINVAAELAVPVPDSLTDDVAAQMVCNPLTALLLHRAAQHHFTVGFDGLVINNAANSAVGRLFTVWAEHHQIPTIGVVRSAARAQQLAVRYPAVPVVSTDNDEWAEQVRAIARGRPISVAVDPVGGQAAADLISLLAPGGTLIAYGMLAPENIPLHPSALIGGEIAIQGLNVGRWLTGASPERRASDIAAVAELVAAQSSELDVAATYSLDQITDAVRHVSRPGKIGTVIVHT